MDELLIESLNIKDHFDAHTSHIHAVEHVLKERSKSLVNNFSDIEKFELGIGYYEG